MKIIEILIFFEIEASLVCTQLRGGFLQLSVQKPFTEEQRSSNPLQPVSKVSCSVAGCGIVLVKHICSFILLSGFLHPALTDEDCFQSFIIL